MGFKDMKASDRSKKRNPSKESRISIKDDRFDTSRPQFRKPKSKDTKVELDSRFKTMLTDPRFQVQTLDKYGRKLSNGDKHKSRQVNEEQLDEFYTVKSEKDESTDGANQNIKHSDERFTLHDDTTDQTLNPTNDSRKNATTDERDRHTKEDPVSRIAYLTALSRGEIEMSSSDGDDGMSSEDNDESDDDDDDDRYKTMPGKEQENIGVLDPSYVEDITAVVDYTTNASPYLAVMNADWTHFRAVDIYAIISSFVPTGAVLRVSVYPSNFGLERLKKEELFGPVDVWKNENMSSQNTIDGQQLEDNNESNGRIDSDEMIGVEEQSVFEADDINSDFDPEKLRLYEASRLKYFFAVVQFTNPQYTDIAYKEVDGMEFEHSSAALDLRIIPIEEISNVIENRKLRDEATGVPMNYNPPDFVVNALQQSAVQCTWDIGDRNREILLTKYNISGQTWGQVSENDDLKAYIASDQSSDEDCSVINKKSNKLRSMLGLESDDDSKGDNNNESNDSDSYDSSQSDNENECITQTSFIPQRNSKTDEKQDRELTPWEKYQEKRQQKKREKRAAIRERRKLVNEERKKSKPKSKQGKSNDDFFVEQNDGDTLIAASSQFIEATIEKDNNEEEDINDNERDFDIRVVQRMEKNKDKKLTGARKRKEERLTGNIGSEFQIDMTDERFKAVIEGKDERFGIDRTDPNFKETPAMKQILIEQTRHRRKQRKLNDEMIQTSGNVPDVNAHAMKPTSGSAALSALVSSIKSKVIQ